MARNNADGQKSRQANGAAHEQPVWSKLNTWSEKYEFEAENTTRLRRGVSVQVGERTIAVKPDFILRRGPKVLAYIGAKNSLRERWKQEDRDALAVHLSAAAAPWICVYGAGEEKPPLDAIRNSAKLEIYGLADGALLARIRELAR